MRKTIFSFLILSCGLVGLACANFIGNPHRETQPAKIVPAVDGDLRVDPPNWWTGMLHNQVELMVHREGIAGYNVRLGEAQDIRLAKVEKGDSPNYLFLTLDIAAGAPAQKLPIIFSHPEKDFSFTHSYTIAQRNLSPKAQGVDSRDVIYLIMPDRFANGNPDNDSVEGMREGLARDSLLGRHGGDLTGIMDHLDYIQDLGITAIWLNPELENDQSSSSYHGYAITDLYKIDARIGTNEQYRQFVRNCHNLGIKVIRDVVPNHIGHLHPWMQDLPTKDWVNTWPRMTQTNYRAPTLVDPYASDYDKKHFNDGWFVPSMPDLNQRNPHLAKYLIQQAIWWVEYSGLDAFRIDTYTYSNQEFMSRFCKEIRDEYPAIHLFGEAWEHTVVFQGFFADDQPMQRARFDSNLPGVVDFQLCFAIQEALMKEQGWTEGVTKVYFTLAQDYFYKDPYKNVIMLDNHDMTRFFSKIGENIHKFKSGIALLLTTRGIPQLYYATEILSTGLEAPSHGNIRKDFPGGWPGDPVNKFTVAGRTAQENEAFDFTRTLIRYRNATPALQTGKLMQFSPANDVYTYFRYDNSKTVMVLINTGNSERRVRTEPFAERMRGFSKAKNVVNGEILTDLSSLYVERNSPLVLELMP